MSELPKKINVNDFAGSQLGKEVCHRYNTYEQLVEALKKINSDYLRNLADWFDEYDKNRGITNSEVQDDLIKWAELIDAALKAAGGDDE